MSPDAVSPSPDVERRSHAMAAINAMMTANASGARL
jgi:hypothetical protein